MLTLCKHVVLPVKVRNMNELIRVKIISIATKTPQNTTNTTNIFFPIRYKWGEKSAALRLTLTQTIVFNNPIFKLSYISHDAEIFKKMNLKARTSC